jgi:hypothetical protein
MTMDALESAVNAPLATERSKRWGREGGGRGCGARGGGGGGGGKDDKSGEVVAVDSTPDGGTAARPVAVTTADRDSSGGGDVDGGVGTGGRDQTMPLEGGGDDPSANDAEISPKKKKKKAKKKLRPGDRDDNGDGGGEKGGSGHAIPQDERCVIPSPDEVKISPKKKKEKKKLRPKLAPVDISMSSNDDEIGLGFHDIAPAPPLAAREKAHDGADVNGGGGKGGRDRPIPREGGGENPSAKEVKKKDEKKKSRPKLTPVDFPSMDDDEIGLGFHDVVPAPPSSATGGKPSTTGGESSSTGGRAGGSSWTVPPGPPPPPDQPDIVAPPPVDGAFVDRRIAPNLEIRNDDRPVVVGGDDSTIATTTNDGANESSSSANYECRNEFLTNIRSENDIISPTFEKKVLILEEQGVIDNGARAPIGGEEGGLVGQGLIKTDAGNECRCLWLCPEPLMKMLRGQNKQNPWVVTPKAP